MILMTTRNLNRELSNEKRICIHEVRGILAQSGERWYDERRWGPLALGTHDYQQRCLGVGSVTKNGWTSFAVFELEFRRRNPQMYK